MYSNYAEDDPRPRCSLDGKVIIADKETAERKASAIRERKPFKNDILMEAYQCKTGFWHVGHGRRSQ